MSLHLHNLNLWLASGKKQIQVLHQISFSLQDGEALGIVGESGCGKSLTALAILQLIPTPPLLKIEGELFWKKRNLLSFTKKQMRKIRSREIAMIFQEPMTALNPVMQVGEQIREVLREHFQLNRHAEKQKIIGLLEKIGIPAPDEFMKNYPHQLSGGMRQRVMIAMALACNPQLLIADEPTTALDVTIQAQILEQLKQLHVQNQMSLLFISHDLDVVAYLTDRILVMYAGEIVESIPAEQLFAQPAHPYTQALQRSRPQTKTMEKLTPISGSVPSLEKLPLGCRFYERCEARHEKCTQQHPPLVSLAKGHQVRCFLYS